MNSVVLSRVKGVGGKKKLLSKLFFSTVIFFHFRNLQKVERGSQRQVMRGSSCFHPYLITLHPLSPYRPTCPMLFPGILIPVSGVWEEKGGEWDWKKTRTFCQSR